MRHIIFLFLLVAGIAANAYAQYSPTADEYTNFSLKELRFNSPRPGTLPVILDFRLSSSKIRIELELANARQLDYLPDLDSLLARSLMAIREIIDSTPEDNISRRVDVYPTQNKVEIRTVSHESNQNTLVYQDGSLSNYKLEKDTLRIRFFSNANGELKNRFPGFITVYVNYLRDISGIGAKTMQSCLSLLRSSIKPDILSEVSPRFKFTAAFDMDRQVMISPTVEWINKLGKRAYSDYRNNVGTIVPSIYGSMQYVRGAIVPSFSAGLSFVISENKYDDHRAYLMWEPYFFFSRVNNQLITDRNDFITFRKVEFIKPEKGGWEFVQNFSLGYLVRRRGTWFEPNTFKFSLPGIRNHTLQLEPEFYFNNFFKNFSPTLKLTLFFE